MTVENRHGVWVESPIEIKEVGFVREIRRGIVRIEGIPSCMYGQVLDFEGSQARGVVVDFDDKQVTVFLLGDAKDLKLGAMAVSHNEIISVPVGQQFIGRVVDSLGIPMDGRKEHIEYEMKYSVFRQAAGVLDRIPIQEQIFCGIKAVDTILPLGKGQRELIIGDRQTGKTTLALDVLLNQKDRDVVCIYCWIGGAHSSLVKILQTLRETRALDYSIVVASSASSSPGEQYLAPYTAVAMGEYFMDRGRDVLVIFDDLTKHAWVYRELSLLLERSPGREAYPGDIFYLHSQLMERAGRMSSERGGGSMTFVPIAEALQGDVTGYIQSNLISMTDGQIYLSSQLFHEGIKPAIDLGLSVSRIGSRVQSEAMREVSENLRLDYLQYKEFLKLVRIRTKMSTEMTERLRRGEALVQLLSQPAHQPVADVDIILLFYAFKRRILEILSVEGLAVFMNEVVGYLRETRPQVFLELAEHRVLTLTIRDELDRGFIDFFRFKKIV